MNRLRKISKVFAKDSDGKRPQNATTKPVYRGSKKPLTVSDIHSHSALENDDFCDELGARRPRYSNHDFGENNVLNILDSFPAPPPLKAVVTDAHPDGRRLYFPMDDFIDPDTLLPPPPDRVLEMVKERERTRTRAARLEQQPTPSSAMPPSTFGISSYRRPLYANSHSNMSTRSLGTKTTLKAGPLAQRAVVQQVAVHNPQRARYVTPPAPQPAGERKRLRSVSTQLSPNQRSAANEELYQAYPSAPRQSKRHYVYI
ncbi:hypothetical protein DFH06DRAFT_411268 [Mycena polygramma]|nr:hypothetical protein DFH06DRAFT_411268 [Mycena polygramma]